MIGIQISVSMPRINCCVCYQARQVELPETVTIKRGGEAIHWPYPTYSPQGLVTEEQLEAAVLESGWVKVQLENSHRSSALVCNECAAAFKEAINKKEPESK